MSADWQFEKGRLRNVPITDLINSAESQPSHRAADEQYLRALMTSPQLLSQSAKRAARISDGMRQLFWAAVDSFQIGVMSVYAVQSQDVPKMTMAGFLALWPVLVAAIAIATLLRRSLRPNFYSRETTSSQVGRTLIGTFLTFVALAAFSLPWLKDPMPHLLRMGIFALMSVALSYLLARLWTYWSMPSQGSTSQVAVIGDVASTDLVFGLLKEGRWDGWRPHLQLSDNDDDLLTLRRSVADGDTDVVIVAVNGKNERLREIVTALPDGTARLCVALDIPFHLNPQFPEHQIWLVDLWRNPHDGFAGALKRLLDFNLAAIALLVLAPFFMVVALAVKLESPGPVIFRQWRFGVCSRPFQVLKFRTMRASQADATGALRTAAHDPRVTRLGRFLRRLSIDELPQLVNVLRGEMSLVGPRAQAMFMQVDGKLMFEALNDYPARHRVLPGITGWAQINGSRGEVDTMEKAQRRTELDLWYIKNWSFWLDIKIVVRTAFGGFITLKAD